MRRRDLLGAALTAPLALRGAIGGAAVPAGAVDWRPLERRLGDRLLRPQSPLAACARAGGGGADALFARLRNPYLLGDDPALTQTFGWVDAWTSQASERAVAAENAADVAAAIRFARERRVRLVVKGGGHSYLGNSNAAGSLLLWTRRMQGVALHDDFAGTGCPANAAPVPAVSIGAGAIWGRVYDAVCVKAGRYVQGGGCLTVGVAGFVQGGGFGSFSKRFGTGAANLIEAEVVTADGRVRIANACREPELFFALRGGGGGTFGVVTRLTLRTHDLPATLGGVIFAVRARSDAAWRALVARIVAFYAEALFNPAWGEQLRFAPGRRLSVSMLCQGLSEAEARAAWAPFLGWIAARPDDYETTDAPAFIIVPGRRLWDPATLRGIPGLTLADDRPGASPKDLYWASNRDEAGQVLNAYQSAWMPADLLHPARQAALVEALIAGAAEWSMTLHTNKGLAGGAAEARAAVAGTATNPAVLDAFALLICAADAPPAWPGIAGHAPDVGKGREEAAAVRRAMAPIRRLVPDAGAYVSESDWFEEDWQRRYWGANYPRLLAAKRRYDPADLFHGRHTVGSG